MNKYKITIVAQSKLTYLFSGLGVELLDFAVISVFAEIVLSETTY